MWSPIQLLALLDLMWSPIQQLPMLSLMYYKSGIKIKILSLWLRGTSGWPLTATYVESLQLIHMYESCSHAMQHGQVISFLVEITFLIPVTPIDLWSKFKTATIVVGLQMYHVHKSHDHATYYVGGLAFLVKMTFWPLWPQMTPNRNFSQ